MGIKLHKESDTRYTIVWSTDIKEETNNDPTSLVIPYSVKGKQSRINIPVGASVVADIEILQPSQRISLNNYSVNFNNLEFEEAFADNITHRVITYNAVQRLWLEGKLIPKMEDHIEQILKDIPRSEKGNPQLKTDLAKGVVMCAYIFTVNNIPTGFQSEYLEMKTGMPNNYITQIINRYSETFELVAKENKSKLIWENTDQLVIKDKPVYFVRHTDRKIKGGYLPMWIEKLVEKELSKIYKAIGYKFTLPPEYKASMEVTK